MFAINEKNKIRVDYTMRHNMTLSFTHRHIQHVGHFSLAASVYYDINTLNEMFGSFVLQKGKMVWFVDKS